jgi:hypothetical protein
MDAIHSTCVSIVNNNPTRPDIDKTLARISVALMDDYKDRFDAIEVLLKKSTLTPENQIESVLNEIFSDDKFNWGRVAVVILWVRARNSPEAGEIFANKTANWIYENGGFDAFVNFFSIKPKMNRFISFIRHFNINRL